MANYPYISVQRALVDVIAQMRKGLPPKVDAGYLQRFKIAPANESYVISILRFIGLIDEAGAPIEERTTGFFGNDAAFHAGLDSAVRRAYSDLFDEMGEDALAADKAALIHWFRAADKTSELVGQRQASTFQTLLGLAGHRDLPAQRGNGAKKSGTVVSKDKSVSQKAKAATPAKGAETTGREEPLVGRDGRSEPALGLTVRVEVNLPGDGDAETYDAIFASIRKHLMS